MSVVSVVVACVAFALALMWSAVGVLALRGALPRNRWLGVRAAATMRSDEAFGVANRVAAPGTLGAASICVVAGVLTLAVGGGWSVLFGVGGLVAAVVLVGVVGGLGVRAAQAIPVSDDAGCSCCASGADAAEAVSDGQSGAAPSSGAEAAHGSSPAAECAESSCASCSLRGACVSGDAPAAGTAKTAQA